MSNEESTEQSINGLTMDELRKLPLGALLDALDVTGEFCQQLQFQGEDPEQFVACVLLVGAEGHRYSERLNLMMQHDAQRAEDLRKREERRAKRAAGESCTCPMKCDETDELDDSRGG